ncbi:type III secretion system chaperone [Robbsia sp. KACC 23696]|uniref:type III secretion system chaperone n=1 Tax=Robbsia sp. KACC 23696 TaxID=3149231 RepID=UPI00325A9799
MKVDLLWRYEELHIDGLPIGMMCDGDPVHGDLLLYSALGKPRQQDAEALNRRLLEGNHLYAGTSGCTLGRHEGSGIVTLYARLPIPLTVPATLLAKVCDLRHVTLIWRHDIQALPTLRAYAN